jgi:glycerophosphoryl diester phosphodiesterase
MNGIKTIDVSRAREIVLATDGYPFLKPTLAESEAALRELLRKDPMLVTLYQATKGIMQGNCSFDDRAYLRVNCEKP